MITSTANQKVKRILKLQKKAKARNEEGVFIVEGIRMMKEAPADRIKELYVSESFLKKPAEIDKKLIERADVVSDVVFSHMSDTKTPQGILAIIERKTNTLDQLIGEKNEKVPFLIVLDHLQDPGNLGTILRTAEGAGVTGIILGKDCADLYQPKVIRSTMGSIYRMPAVFVEDMKETVRKLKRYGVHTYAAHLDESCFYDEEDYTKPTAFLIGNEGNGLPEDICAEAEHKIKIPMHGQVESLNAAMAAGILMYEVCRQRRSGDSEAV